MPLKQKTKTVYKSREVQVPCPPTQMGGTNDNPGPIPCSACNGRGHRTKTEHYTEDETEFVVVDDE